MLQINISRFNTINNKIKNDVICVEKRLLHLEIVKIEFRKLYKMSRSHVLDKSEAGGKAQHIEFNLEYSKGKVTIYIISILIFFHVLNIDMKKKR